MPLMTKQILQPSLEEFLALLTHRCLSLPPHVQLREGTPTDQARLIVSAEVMCGCEVKGSEHFDALNWAVRS